MEREEVSRDYMPVAGQVCALPRTAIFVHLWELMESEGQS